MKNTCAIEYHHCDFWLRRLERSLKKEEVIDTIIAGLYRPEGKGSSSDDKREKFDSKRIDFNLKHIRKMSPEDKIMILTWFIACHIEINKKYKPMFQAGDEDAGEVKKENLGVLGLIFTVSETGIFGDFEKTCYTPVHTLFTYWTKKILDSKA
jgi:hypothetical protein